MTPTTMRTIKTVVSSPPDGAAVGSGATDVLASVDEGDDEGTSELLG